MDLVVQSVPDLSRISPERVVLGGDGSLTDTQVRCMCEHIRRDTEFGDVVSSRQFRTTVLIDL